VVGGGHALRICDPPRPCADDLFLRKSLRTVIGAPYNRRSCAG